MAKRNPTKALDAIINPAPLTLAHIAMLEKCDAPILGGDISKVMNNIIAVWIYKTPIAEVSKNFDRREECALAMVEKMGGQQYGEALAELCSACNKFFEMLPRSESSDGDAQKKTSQGSEMDGLQSSQSSFAEHTNTVFAKCLKRFRASASRFFIAVGRKLSGN